MFNLVSNKGIKRDYASAGGGTTDLLRIQLKGSSKGGNTEWGWGVGKYVNIQFWGAADVPVAIYIYIYIVESKLGPRFEFF